MVQKCDNKRSFDIRKLRLIYELKLKYFNATNICFDSIDNYHFYKCANYIFIVL